MVARYFSLTRLTAMLIKEFRQMFRDKGTLVMIIMLPLMQLILFGYAINLNPRNLKTVVVESQPSVFTRQFIRAMENTSYFNVVDTHVSNSKAQEMIAESKASFAVQFEPNFERKLIRGQKPEILVSADASDPSTTGKAISALENLQYVAFNDLYKDGLQYLAPSDSPFKVVVHAQYNPESITRFAVVPGLMGMVLTMTLVMITAQAITREYERGTVETLMSMPVSGVEVMLGKIVPYILIGYIQISIILAFSAWIFKIPFLGSLILLLLATLPFIAANLCVGLTISTYAKTQLQAMQMTIVYFLPSILLSGFMFPFYGMPKWAQHIGSVLPLTYYTRITRGIMLKGNTLIQVWPQIWPILVIFIVVLAICVGGYRSTLD